MVYIFRCLVNLNIYCCRLLFYVRLMSWNHHPNESEGFKKCENKIKKIPEDSQTELSAATSQSHYSDSAEHCRSLGTHKKALEESLVHCTVERQKKILQSCVALNSRGFTRSNWCHVPIKSRVTTLRLGSFKLNVSNKCLVFINPTS